MTPSSEHLYPGRADLAWQTDLAWQLLRDETAAPHERAHAKCFLTYRTIDHDVMRTVYEDQIRLPLPMIPDLELRTRWTLSQQTAEFYLACLQDGSTVDPWEDRTPSEISGLNSIHPAFLVHWLRVQTVCCYDALQRGQLTGERISSVIRFALRELGAIPFATRPLRVFEMRDDWHALAALILIGQQHGCIAACDAPWASAAMIARDDGHLPYVRCLKQVGTNGHASRLW